MFSSVVLLQALLSFFAYIVSASSALENEELRKHREITDLSRTIDDILRTYDRKIRPNNGGIPVQVQIEMKVVSFGSLKEANMEFSMDIFFRQWWVDPRFKHNSSTPFNMAADPTETFWTPDTYFVNVKNSKYHHVTRENMRVKIYKDGRIYFSSRITMSAQCNMDFRLFPMDTQNCSLVIESYAYTTQEVDYEWRKTKQNKGKGIEIVSDEMAQFEVIEVKTASKAATNSKGSFASLKVTFSFKRRITYFLSSVFVPAVILVLLSWCCLWIDKEAVPARIALGIITILSSILLTTSINRQMPKVSYMKALDFFMLSNLGFIVLAFFEYIAVLNTKPELKWLTRIYSSMESKKQEADETPKNVQPGINEPEEADETPKNVQPGINEPELVVIPDAEEYSVPQVKSVLVTEDGVYPRIAIIRRTTPPPSPTHQCVPETHKASHKHEKELDLVDPPICRVHWIDGLSKRLFPCCYIVFLMWFWFQYRESFV